MIRPLRGPSLLFVAASCLAVTPAEATVQVGSIADSRFGNGWSLDGSNLTHLREKLLEPANFGAGGIYSNDIAISDVADPLTAGVLASFDVFFIGYLWNGSANAFTASELAWLDEWVRNGGTLIATCDDVDYDAVCEFFGHPVSISGSSLYRPTTNGLEQLPFNGPFGVVDEVRVHGGVGAFADTTGTGILAREVGAGRGSVLLKSLGRGRIVFLGDVDTISDNSLTSGPGIDNENDQFAGNLFAFAADFCGGPVLCLVAQRFAVTVDWATTTRSGVGTGTALGVDTGNFWFFRGDNVELIVKVINACSLNGHFWVFAGGLTNVQVTITVTDRETGLLRVYNNLQSMPFEPVQDTEAFATCVL